MRLSQDLLDHFAVNIRQPPVAAIIAKCELLVVDAQQMQNRRMQIVAGNFCLPLPSMTIRRFGRGQLRP